MKAHLIDIRVENTGPIFGDNWADRLVQAVSGGPVDKPKFNQKHQSDDVQRQLFNRSLERKLNK
jgi:hypothetical protein